MFRLRKRIIKTASYNSYAITQQKYTTGQKLADKVASVGGSWKFLICFGIFLLLWASLNSINFFFKPFDPYPFTLLNVVLSCMAAVQAPIIIMSQRRLDERDRELAEHDLEIDIQVINKLFVLDDKIDKLLVILDEKDKKD
jgi:uncharacterized membrane protein